LGPILFTLEISNVREEHWCRKKIQSQ
jgi:hypothetical protein